jgi:uncharacterized protein (TIGR03790 family)
MQHPGRRWLVGGTVLFLGWAAANRLHAGGSGLNTVVLINQNSANSRELGNYYCERRQVPPENVLRINWPGGNLSWSSGDFQTNLLSPLLNMLAERQLTNQVDYVVLSMDIPFQTFKGTKGNSTTAALFYGLKDDGGTNWTDLLNSYYASEQVFRQARPASAPGYSFLTAMLTADSLARAKALVDQGVASDGTWPAQPVMLAKSSDPARNLRYHLFDNAIFNSQLLQRPALLRVNSDSPAGQTNLFGYETGLSTFSVSPAAFVPGAMADSLSSFGGLIFGTNSQTPLLAFTQAGATGSYGTVVEPSANSQKFPNAQNYFYQGRGFSLAECYYQSLYAPYQGLIVGEPLAAPFARTASGTWSGVTSNSTLKGTTQLSVAFSSVDPNCPLQQVDLFVDGNYFQALTNCGPRAGNIASVSLNGYRIAYTVPPGAGLGTVASGLAAMLNSPTTTNLTRIAAQAYGDRVELRLLASNSLATPFYVTDGSTTNPAARYFSAQYLSGAPAPSLGVRGRGSNGDLGLSLQALAGTPCYVQASTDLRAWVTIFTNLTGGSVDLVDPSAGKYSRRFYRVLQTLPDPRPLLAPLGLGNGTGFKLRISNPGGSPYIIQSSTNLLNWVSICTNASGGAGDFNDDRATNSARRFYRALALPQALPQLSLQQGTSGSGLLVRVDGASQPCVILESTDQVQWTPVFTNLTVGQVQTVVGSSAGSADVLTTFLTASRGAFLDSSAYGLRAFNVTGTISAGAWLQLRVVKTNSEVISLSVTNTSGVATLFDLSQQLITAINSCPALQAGNGLVGEDLVAGLFGTASFNLRARSPGRDGAAIQAQLIASAGLGASPSSVKSLDSNLSDLQPRNHLYVSAGASRLALSFSLDTTSLADGYHELTAVAYEGSHVRTQTRLTIPVQVRNTALSASLTSPDLTDTASAHGTYHVQVAANTNTVTAISLLSTGGLLGTATNQPTATFTVDGSFLGAGLHPLFALVTTSNGIPYRTAVRWVRLINP